jgi:hypothetical protein
MLPKLILTKDQLYQVVQTNRYPIDKINLNFSRCIDGRYQNMVGLSPLTIPGGDVGQLAVIFAAANNFGFAVDKEKVFEILIDFLQGEKNFHFHTDDHSDEKIPAGGCGYFKLIKKEPEKFFLTNKDIDFIEEKLAKLVKDGVKPTVLHGHHDEAAVVMIKGNEGILPRFEIETTVDGETKKITSSIFVFHQTLFKQRQKKLAEMLLSKKAIELFPGLDEEYLTFTLIETGENHLFETLSQLGKGLPIYQVVFEHDLEFKIKELGKVEKV